MADAENGSHKKKKMKMNASPATAPSHQAAALSTEDCVNDAREGSHKKKKKHEEGVHLVRASPVTVPFQTVAYCEENAVNDSMNSSDQKKKKKQRQQEVHPTGSGAATDPPQTLVLNSGADLNDAVHSAHKKRKRKQELDPVVASGAISPSQTGARHTEDSLHDARNGTRKKEKHSKRELHPVGASAATNSCQAVVPHTEVTTKSDEVALSNYTVSIAIAGSIIHNAQSLSLATTLAGQIARAAAIFKVDEIVVFDDGEEDKRAAAKGSDEVDESGGVFLARILQFMEAPQYLRQSLFPKHSCLQFAGRLPPLDVPHQARRHEWLEYREGIVLDKAAPTGGGSCVDVGLYQEVVIRQSVKSGVRVTVAMGPTRPQKGEGKVLEAVAVSEPKEKAGLYWGYTVRHAPRLSAVFTECPFPGGYDYTVGTSEHGQKIRPAELEIPKFKHLLVAFGGLAGLEESKDLDQTIEVEDVACLFDCYLNTCPGQGSRTIRTEEAVLISMQYLQDPIMRAVGSWAPPKL